MNFKVKHVVCILTILLLGWPSSGKSQNKEVQLVEEISSAYNQLNYSEAEIKARAVLKNYQNFTSQQLTEIHKILAFIYYSQNKQAEARLQFEYALSITPELQLDPLYVSPKIMNFFKQIKVDQELKSRQSIHSDSGFRYVLVQDLRPSAALRSMILPGWGQLYKKEKTKGKVLLAMWTVGLSGSVITYLARNNAKNKYLSETSPAKIESCYNSYNRLHKLRNNVLIFSAGVWLYSYIDAVLKKGSNKLNTSSSEKALLILPSFSSNRANLTLLMNL